LREILVREDRLTKEGANKVVVEERYRGVGSAENAYH
jgi:hypothetical protein